MAGTKASLRSFRRHDGDDELVIVLPDPRLLRLIARSVLLAAAILSFPWLRYLASPAAISAGEAPPATENAGTLPLRWVDNPFLFPMLIRDLRREGLFGAEGRHVFLGDPGARLPFLKSNDIEPVEQGSGYWSGGVRERSVDLVLAADGLENAGYAFVEKALRIGGIVVVRLSSDSEQPFRLPPNYRIVYIRRFGSTIVAIKKTAHAAAGEDNVGFGGARKLLGLPKLRKNFLSGIENLLLEPSIKGLVANGKTTSHLSDGISLSPDQYPRRVFIDAGSRGKSDSEKWFQMEYLKKNTEFEMVRLNVESKENKNVGGISEWLGTNVRKEDFVVMRAHAEDVETMMVDRTIGLVDELFLECNNEWQKGMPSGRAYGRCLALSGKLRDEGVLSTNGGIKNFDI